MKSVKFVVLLSIVAMFLSACAGTSSDTTRTYLKNGVSVRYQESTISGPDDQITLTFYRPGNYRVVFSKTPGEYTKWAEYMPKDFPITVDPGKTPFTKIVPQKIIPTNIRITISSDAATEYNDFK